jgi:hypothetical protein
MNVFKGIDRNDACVQWEPLAFDEVLCGLTVLSPHVMLPLNKGACLSEPFRTYQRDATWPLWWGMPDEGEWRDINLSTASVGEVCSFIVTRAIKPVYGNDCDVSQYLTRTYESELKCWPDEIRRDDAIAILANGALWRSKGCGPLPLEAKYSRFKAIVPILCLVTFVACALMSVIAITSGIWWLIALSLLGLLVLTTLMSFLGPPKLRLRFLADSNQLTSERPM